VDEQDLPDDLSKLVIGSGYHPETRDDMGLRVAQVHAGLTTRADDRQLDYNGANGPGGVCASVSAADPALAAPPSPSPLIPDQPLPPGAPAGLAEAMGQTLAADPGLSTPSTGLSTGAPLHPEARDDKERAESGQSRSIPSAGINGSGAAHQADQGPALTRKTNGRAHPYKPLTPMAIAEFAGMWHDKNYTVAQIAKRYRCGERTVQDWRMEFGLPTRPDALKAQAEVNTLAGSAVSMVDAVTTAARVQVAMARAPGQPDPGAVAGQIIGYPPLPPDALDPLKDQEIGDAMRDIMSEARIMSAHSDLKALHRKLSRLAVLVAVKAPRHTWDSLLFTVEGLARATLRARQVEAQIPEGEHDPVQLRKEAAGQMMRELKSVLTPSEQQALATLVKAGADRLMAKGGDAQALTGVAAGAEATS
jgi:hypothetical protein